ncbi:C40 family peptidase [Humibacter ginsenosidimutans]|nr:NlpC/P60 family protein [Humibacter ginsenosidimutans]
MTDVDGGTTRRPSNRTGAFSRGSMSIGAAAVGVMTGAIGIIVPPAHADDYPNWNDVQQAKQNVKDKQALVDKITTLIGDLQNSADAASVAADKAAEAYLVTKSKLDDAAAKADDLQTQSKAAAKTAHTSVMRAGLLASHLAQTGGDSSLGLLLSGGDAETSDKLLYQLGAMSQLSAQSNAIYQQAVKDKNTASSLADQASAAEKSRKQLEDAAATDLEAANDAAAAAQSALAAQKSKQTELVSQLASLQNTSTKVAGEYAVGVAKLAQEQAEKKAATPPPPSQAAPSAPSGGSGSGGSSGSSGGSSGGAPSSGGGSVGAPNSSAVETAINYAYAHLGAPYKLGGAGPTYYDCSGLVMMAYAAAGIYVGDHNVGDQFAVAQARGQLVPLSQRQRGDIIFWYDDGFYHDAIYLGGNQIIAARDYGEPLAVEGLWGSPYPYVARPSA